MSSILRDGGRKERSTGLGVCVLLSQGANVHVGICKSVKAEEKVCESASNLDQLRPADC